MKRDGKSREPKKRVSRAKISEVATALFFERGFDAVTVDDVARAAGVSKMTVFNHFARKEDLMFDREAEGLDLLRAALASRADKSVISALRKEAKRLVEGGNVFARFEADVLPFWKVVDESPAFRARFRELAEEIEAELVPHFEGPNAALVASLVVAGWRAAYRAGLEAARGGKSAKKAAAEFERILDVTAVAARAAQRA